MDQLGSPPLHDAQFAVHDVHAVHEMHDVHDLKSSQQNLATPFQQQKAVSANSSACTRLSCSGGKPGPPQPSWKNVPSKTTYNGMSGTP